MMVGVLRWRRTVANQLPFAIAVRARLLAQDNRLRRAGSFSPEYGVCYGSWIPSMHGLAAVVGQRHPQDQARGA
jgi:hypothetical protein